jgi:hypothetical protein
VSCHAEVCHRTGGAHMSSGRRWTRLRSSSEVRSCGTGVLQRRRSQLLGGVICCCRSCESHGMMLWTDRQLSWWRNRMQRVDSSDIRMLRHLHLRLRKGTWRIGHLKQRRRCDTMVQIWKCHRCSMSLHERLLWLLHENVLLREEETLLQHPRQMLLFLLLLFSLHHATASASLIIVTILSTRRCAFGLRSLRRYV